jgi:hypothetical protein
MDMWAGRDDEFGPDEQAVLEKVRETSPALICSSRDVVDAKRVRIVEDIRSALTSRTVGPRGREVPGLQVTGAEESNVIHLDLDAGGGDDWLADL